MKGEKFDNPPIMFAVAESELQRFRELETENTLLKVQIEGLKKENEQLEELIKKMISCANCQRSYEENDELRCDVINCLNFDKWEFAE